MPRDSSKLAHRSGRLHVPVKISFLSYNSFEMQAQLSHFLSRAIAVLRHDTCNQSTQKSIEARRELKAGQSRSSDSL
jgi:hypothetical protein